MSAHTPGPWRKGKWGGSVVTDEPAPGIAGSDAVDFYGGHLIAESICAPNIAIIAAAPDMLDALVDARAVIVDERECYFESHRNQATGDFPDDCRPYLDCLDAVIAKVDAAIAKATSCNAEPQS